LNNTPAAVDLFLQNLACRKIPGIGKVTERILKTLGIEKVSDAEIHGGYINFFFKESSKEFLLRVFSGNTRVERDASSMYQRKSISCERTFSAKGKSDEKELLEICEKICENLAEDVKKKELAGKTVTLKLKTVKFEVTTRSISSDRFISSASDLFKLASILLQRQLPIKIRLMGVKLTNFRQTLPDSKSQKQLNDFFKKSTDRQDRKRALLAQIEPPRKRKKKNTIESFFKNHTGTVQLKKNEADSRNIVPEKIQTKAKDTLMTFFKNHTATKTMDYSIQKIQPRAKVQHQKRKKKNTIEEFFSAPVISQKYTCPVCASFSTSSNMKLNDHMDECLK